jgi:hypothetical protein
VPVEKPPYRAHGNPNLAFRQPFANLLEREVRSLTDQRQEKILVRRQRRAAAALL